MATSSQWRVHRTGFDHVAGAHRIQRVPDTEKAGRRHSSFVTITVLSEQDVAVVDLSCVVEKFYRGSGPGGQHRNKTDSAVRLVHPSGLTVCSEQERSQWQNRRVAWAEMERRLNDNARGIDHAQQNLQRVEQMNDRGWTWTAWRDEVVDRSSGRRARMQDLLKGKNWHKMA